MDNVLKIVNETIKHNFSVTQHKETYEKETQFRGYGERSFTLKNINLCLH